MKIRREHYLGQPLFVLQQLIEEAERKNKKKAKRECKRKYRG